MADDADALLADGDSLNQHFLHNPQEFDEPELEEHQAEEEEEEEAEVKEDAQSRSSTPIQEHQSIQPPQTEATQTPPAAPPQREPTPVFSPGEQQQEEQREDDDDDDDPLAVSSGVVMHHDAPDDSAAADEQVDDDDPGSPRHSISTYVEEPQPQQQHAASQPLISHNDSQLMAHNKTATEVKEEEQPLTSTLTIVPPVPPPGDSPARESSSSVAAPLLSPSSALEAPLLSASSPGPLQFSSSASVVYPEVPARPVPTPSHMNLGYSMDEVNVFGTLSRGLHTPRDDAESELDEAGEDEERDHIAVPPEMQTPEEAKDHVVDMQERQAIPPSQPYPPVHLNQPVSPSPITSPSYYFAAPLPPSLPTLVDFPHPPLPPANLPLGEVSFKYSTVGEEELEKEGPGATTGSPGHSLDDSYRYSDYHTSERLSHGSTSGEGTTVGMTLSATTVPYHGSAGTIQTTMTFNDAAPTEDYRFSYDHAGAEGGEGTHGGLVIGGDPLSPALGLYGESVPSPASYNPSHQLLSPQYITSSQVSNVSMPLSSPSLYSPVSPDQRLSTGSSNSTDQEGEHHPLEYNQTRSSNIVSYSAAQLRSPSPYADMTVPTNDPLSPYRAHTHLHQPSFVYNTPLLSHPDEVKQPVPEYGDYYTPPEEKQYYDAQPGAAMNMTLAGVPSVVLHDGVGVSEIELQRSGSTLANGWQKDHPTDPYYFENENKEGGLSKDAAIGGGAVSVRVEKPRLSNNKSGSSKAIPRSNPASPRGKKGSVSKAGKGRSADGEPPPVKPWWPVFTIIVMILDIVLVLLMLGYDDWTFTDWFTNAMAGPSPLTLLHFGAKFTPDILQNNQQWRLFVPLSLHAGLIHLAGSLIVGGFYAITLERTYGPHLIAPIWLVSGVFGVLTSALFSPLYVGVAGGAAMNGLIGAWVGDFIHTYEWMEGNRLLYFLRTGTTSTVLFVLGVFPIVDNWAQLAGYVGGVLMSTVMFTFQVDPRTGQKKHKLLPACMAIWILVPLIAGVALALYINGNPYYWCDECHWVGCIDTGFWDCSSGAPAGCFTTNGTDSKPDTLAGWC